MPVILDTNPPRHGPGQTYDFPGSETDLLSRGLASTGRLVSFESRLRLSLLLRSGASREAPSRGGWNSGGLSRPL